MIRAHQARFLQRLMDEGPVLLCRGQRAELSWLFRQGYVVDVSNQAYTVSITSEGVQQLQAHRREVVRHERAHEYWRRADEQARLRAVVIGRPTFGPPKRFW